MQAAAAFRVNSPSTLQWNVDIDTKADTSGFTTAGCQTPSGRVGSIGDRVALVVAARRPPVIEDNGVFFLRSHHRRR